MCLRHTAAYLDGLLRTTNEVVPVCIMQIDLQTASVWLRCDLLIISGRPLGKERLAHTGSEDGLSIPYC